MDYTALTSLAILSAIVSALVQYLKTKYGGGAKTLLILAGLSILGSIGYVYLQAHSNYWQTLLAVLVGANAIYSFVLQWFEK